MASRLEFEVSTHTHTAKSFATLDTTTWCCAWRVVWSSRFPHTHAAKSLATLDTTTRCCAWRVVWSSRFPHTHTHTLRSPSQHWTQRHGAALDESFGLRGFHTHTHAAKSFATLGELHFGVLDTVVAPARAPVAPTNNDTIVDITFRSRSGVAPVESL